MIVPSGMVTSETNEAASQGRAVPEAGVAVEAQSPALQGTRTTTSDGEGSYRFTLLPPGDYTLAAVQDAGGPFDVVVNCATVPGTEMASILAARDGGTVLFFSMATSFTAAALGAEGVGKDATLIVGNGYVPGHADLTLELLRRNAALRALFEARYVRR